MKKFVLLAFASAATLALSACGSSGDADEQATPDTVEMPAEEQLSTVAADPVPDSAPATAPADPNAAAKPNDAAAAAAAAAADFNAAGDGAEQAIDQAEKKM